MTASGMSWPVAIQWKLLVAREGLCLTYTSALLLLHFFTSALERFATAKKRYCIGTGDTPQRFDAPRKAVELGLHEPVDHFRHRLGAPDQAVGLEMLERAPVNHVRPVGCGKA